MAIKNWDVHHREFKCDKCGHTEADDTAGPQVNQVDQTRWLVLDLTQPEGTPTPSNPLGTPGKISATMVLCPGCRGMMETFLEIDIHKHVPRSYGDATTGAMPAYPYSQVKKSPIPPGGVGGVFSDPQAAAKLQALAQSMGMGDIFKDPRNEVKVALTDPYADLPPDPGLIEAITQRIKARLGV